MGQLAWGAQTGWEAKAIHRDLCWGIFTEEFVPLESKWLITFFPPVISKVKKKKHVIKMIQGTTTTKK